MIVTEPKENCAKMPANAISSILVELELLGYEVHVQHIMDEDTSVVQETVKELILQQKTITSAESLTAGLFQSTLGEVEGVSAVFPGGVVTYSKEVKQQLLGIDAHLLQTYGVVSKECALEMATKAQQLFQTDYALSFTGVAGPGELEGKEVGTVWVGLAKPNNEYNTQLFHFSGTRQFIRQNAVMAGLNLLRDELIH